MEYALYPVFLDATKLTCVMAGIGAVGQRKLDKFLQSGGKRAIIFDPFANAPEKYHDCLVQGRIKLVKRQIIKEDLLEANLVFAATSNPAENERISVLCRQLEIPCNNASDPDQGTFITPAVIKRGSLQLALTCGGASPMLARLFKEELEAWLSNRYKFVWLMGKLRPLVLSCGFSQKANKEIFAKMTNSPIPIWLEGNDLAKCENWLSENFPFLPSAEIDSLFREIKNVCS